MRRVFAAEKESQLCEYIKRSPQIMFGLTLKEARKLAYECGVPFGVNVPISWKSNKCAGQDWFIAFMKRNPELSIGQAELTSLARCTSFKMTNVSQFYENLSDVLSRD
ncbi:hypothetical protein PR048_011953 [Dryococelus australis]|uniref:Uncharacterized protein n=1 Tax=Dryococelus australis TaxID=614101 RepID=A0ABQ9HN27_9NEOP|nr:hypothetical protein PR048_011953 [Dryococelus australis]